MKGEGFRTDKKNSDTMIPIVLVDTGAPSKIRRDFGLRSDESNNSGSESPLIGVTLQYMVKELP